MLSVVAFHAFPGWIKGGFIGVDVFFVISGYLISTIIFENLDRGTFSFSEFYARRIKRIFPALLLVLLASYIFGWFVLLAHEYKQLGKHIAAGAGFFSNIVFWKEAGYFDNSAETKPLLHLWSLGIEEQFYIAWPLLLWISWKRKFNLLAITILIAVLSFYLNVMGIKKYPVATFYSPLARFWELLCGSLLAWVMLYRKGALIELDGWLVSAVYRDNRKADGKTLSNILSFIGLLLLAYGFWRINKQLSFPGKWAIVPVLGTVLIIFAGTRAYVNRTILANKVAVWFGLISFPLYLWHWPLLSFSRIIEGEVPGRNIRIAAVVLSIVLAWLTYKLVERPLRLGKHSRTKVIALVVLMSIVGSVGYSTYSKGGLGFRLQKFELISKAAREWQYPGSLKEFPFKGKIFLRQDSGNSQTTLFVGDSNMEQYYPRMDELIKSNFEKTNSIIFSTIGGCLPIPSAPYTDEFKGYCSGFMETALQLASQDPRISNVVIGGQWSGYFYRGYGLTAPLSYGSDSYKSTLSKLYAYIKELRGLGKNVFLVLNAPEGEELDPMFMAQRGLRNFPDLFKYRDGGIKRALIEEKYGGLQLDLRQMAESLGAVVIQPSDYLCDAQFCPSVDKHGGPIYKDAIHLRPTYVRNNADFMDVTVTATTATPPP